MARRKQQKKPQPVMGRAAPSAPQPSPQEVQHPDAPGAERWRPWLLGGMCTLLVLRPLYPSESAASEGDGLVVVMLWIALAVLWLLAAIGRPRWHVRFGWTDAAVLVLIGWHTLTAVWAALCASPRPALNMLWEWIGYGLCFLLARQLLASRRDIRAALVVMIALAVGLAGYGLYQYAVELPATRAEYRSDPDAALRKAGMWFPEGSRERQLFQKRLESAEPIATFALTNSLAGFLAPWLVVTAGIGASTGLNLKQWRAWLAALACAAPIAVCLILTKSRSAYLATLLGLVAVGLLCRRRKIQLDWRLAAGIVAFGAVLLAIVIAVHGVDAKVLSEASKSLGYRLQYWRSTMEMIAEHPIVGCGPGNFQDTYTLYILPEASEEIAEPHNFLMEIWATTGTPGLWALLAVLFLFGRAMIRSRRALEGQDAGQASSAAWAVGGLVGGFVLSIPVGQMSSAAPSLVQVMPGVYLAAAVLIGLPLAGLAMLALWRWVREGPLLPSLPAIGAVVLLVNLLAAGAIGFPSVAYTLWLLAAVGLNLAEGSTTSLPRWAAFVALAAMMAVVLTCSTTAFSPVLRSQAAMRLAESEPSHAEEHLREAANADPMNAVPWQLLALSAFGQWQTDGSPQALDDFEACVRRAVELAPRSARTWQMGAERYLQAYMRTGRQEDLRKAIEAYGQAVILYPNSAWLRGEMALALWTAGDQERFRQEAKVALALDARTPHSDKQLDPALRDELRKWLSRTSSQPSPAGD